MVRNRIKNISRVSCLSQTRLVLPLLISVAVNIKRAKVFKLHEDLACSDWDFICKPVNIKILLWLQSNTHIKVFIKTILGQVNIKWGIGQELKNDLSTKPI